MNRKFFKILAVILALVMAFSLAACGNKAEETNTTSTETPATATPTETPVETAVEPAGDAEVVEPVEEMDPELAEFLADVTYASFDREYDQTRAADPNTPLVVAYGNFGNKFSPFFGESAYDMDVEGMTQLTVMTYDRVGNIVYNAIQGETRNFNGVDYDYKGIANLYQKYDPASDTTTYRARIRDDLVFSDGVPVTIDDLIFTYYVLLDPSYTGSSTLYSYDIVGLNEYRTQTTSEVYDKYEAMGKAILEAGADHAWSSADSWTQEQQDSFWNDGIKKVWIDKCNEIVKYCMDTYLARYAEAMLGRTPAEVNENEGLQVAFGMMMWGFGDFAEGEDGNQLFTGAVTGKTWTLVDDDCPTLEDYYAETFEAYAGVQNDFWATENTGGDEEFDGYVVKDFVMVWGPLDESLGGAGIPNISGIRKLNDYAVEIEVKGFSAPAIYHILGQEIAPMHYYGDVSQYDYENNKFGFPFSDLSIIRDKTRYPLGAGPYKFIKFENKVVYFEANPLYYKGEPLVKNLQFKETITAEVATGVVSATHDVGEMSGSTTNLSALKGYNSNGEVTGDIVTTSMVDNLGYGYLALEALNMSVNGERGSEASKNLRKGLATVLAVFRETATNTYYGEMATTINYPISNTSWAAPQPTDEGYRVAYSRDVNGNDIYTADMTQEDKVAAAIQACLGFLEAAGFTIEDGKVTAGPGEVRTTTRGDMSYLDYEFWITAQGTDDHPAYAILTDFKAVMAGIGINIEIVNPSDSNDVFDSFHAGICDMFLAAWGSTIDPDIYQTYHGDQIIGKAGSAESNIYGIDDPELNDLIMKSRASDDPAYRKAVLKQCFDIILDWGVEVPNYQRKNFIIFSTERVNIETLNPMITTYNGWMSDFQKVEMR